ncbi:MAG TPA: hypothetical protein VF604_14565 [Pyrinomonadaceae bacterium]|jgi:hypothetical protein
MKTKFLFSALLICLSAFGLSAAAQPKQPKTVRDFFMLLPAKYFSLDCCIGKDARKSKQEYLERYLNVEDTANGYLSGAGDAAQEGFVMTLFKRANGTYLIAFYTYGEGGVEDTPWCVFLDYKNGKWTDVSRAVVPNYNAKKYIYELPQQGTTIEVFGKDEMGEDFYKGKKLYDLAWQNGKFSKSGKQ